MNNKIGSAMIIVIFVLAGIFLMAFGSSFLVIIGGQNNDITTQSQKAYYLAEAGAERFKFARMHGDFNFSSECGLGILSNQLPSVGDGWPWTYTINCETSTPPGKVVAIGHYRNISRRVDTGYCFDINQECTSACALGSVCGGGTLFSKNPNLIAAPSQNSATGCVGGANCDPGNVDSTTYQWLGVFWTIPPYPPAIGATSTSDGRINATAIRAYNPPGISGFQAANACESLLINGFNGWYLPAQDELNTLLKNADFCENNVSGPLPRSCLNREPLPASPQYPYSPIVNGFTNQKYWSSTEIDDSTAYDQDFNNGTQTADLKAGTYYVRCVRRF